jgi:hypothetical protein
MRFPKTSRSRSTPATRRSPPPRARRRARPSGCRTTRPRSAPRNGKTLVTDGPYVGIKEAIGAYFIFEGDGLDAALKLAAQAPALRYGGAVEVRPAEAYWE